MGGGEGGEREATIDSYSQNHVQLSNPTTYTYIVLRIHSAFGWAKARRNDTSQKIAVQYLFDCVCVGMHDIAVILCPRGHNACVHTIIDLVQ